MDNTKIAFIICTNDMLMYTECMHFIEALEVPQGMTVEVFSVEDASSMASGYNEAMQVTDAKYKVYLHQDVFIINKQFIFDILEVFEDENVGMLGVVGNILLGKTGCPWQPGETERVGKVNLDMIYKIEETVFSDISKPYQEVIVIDGLLMVTQYDLPWREDLFCGWHFYDCSHSLEFIKAGYKVVVPYMKNAWCIHENDILNLSDYDKWRNVFITEYKQQLSEISLLV